MKIRLTISYLFVLVFILYAQIILVRVESIPLRVCEVLRADGYLLDRFNAGRGDVRDAQGNPIAFNVRGETILHVCYGLDGQPQRGAAHAMICAGCAPARTPGIK